MFSTLKTAVMAVVLVLVFLLGVVVYGSVYTSQPQLPSTTMTGLRLDTYVYSLRKLRRAGTDNPVSIALSPAETSFLIEKIPPDFSWGQFAFEEAYLESSGELIRILAVFQGPLGLYYRLDFYGTLKYNTGDWTVRTRRLKLGKVPVTWFVSSPRVVRANGIGNEAINFRKATLDGKGFRGTFTKFDVKLDEIIRNG